tara:strand:- start:4055 stop:4579 length:525 start_codon:yes stop_codon:yes gene_type:complete
MDNIIDNSLNNIKNKKIDQCQELKNIEYKTMLLNGTSLMSKKDSNNNIDKITNFLENESDANKKEPWIKLDKTQKIKKLNDYINKLSNDYNLTSEENKNFQQLLMRYFERKNLTKAKDVSYNKETGIILNIPNLFFNENTRNFYFKKDDKHVSTVKSLPPDKKSKTKTLKIHDD